VAEEEDVATEINETAAASATTPNPTGGTTPAAQPARGGVSAASL